MFNRSIGLKTLSYSNNRKMIHLLIDIARILNQMSKKQSESS